MEVDSKQYGAGVVVRQYAAGVDLRRDVALVSRDVTENGMEIYLLRFGNGIIELAGVS